jgi:hypothetical protein
MAGGVGVVEKGKEGVGESVKYEVGWSIIMVSNRLDVVQSERN